MAEKTSLSDDENVKMVEVSEAEGLSVEDAYRVLADMPLEPVEVPEEE